jgi:hypothetical protein
LTLSNIGRKGDVERDESKEKSRCEDVKMKSSEVTNTLFRRARGNRASLCQNVPRLRPFVLLLKII